MRQNEKPIFVCPKCGSTRPTIYDPYGCARDHEWTKMIPLVMPDQVVQLKTQKISTGPLKYASNVAFLLAFCSILAWIWLLDWRFAPTSILLVFSGIFLFGGSLKEVPAWEADTE